MTYSTARARTAAGSAMTESIHNPGRVSAVVWSHAANLVLILGWRMGRATSAGLRGLEQFDSLAMVREQLWQLLRRCAAKAAIRRQTKVRHEFARDRQPFAEAVHAVDHPKVDAGVAGL